MQIRVASAQPRALRGEEEFQNLSTALNYIDEAADAGAKLVTFPEGFPGPYNHKVTWSAFEAISEKARKRKVYVVYGTVDQVPDEPDGTFFLALKFIGPDGSLLDSYYRMQPNTADVDRVLMRDKIIAPGNRVVVHETEIGKIGLLICSEMYCPELPRLLALQGVEILVAPIGGLVYELADTWKCILWARAIENLCYVVTSQNLYGMENGMGMIAGPEEILAQSPKPGLIIADCDLDRIHWLKNQRQSLGLPKPYKVIPGLLRYRRPELYGPICAEQSDNFDFYYYKNALKGKGVK